MHRSDPDTWEADFPWVWLLLLLAQSQEAGRLAGHRLRLPGRLTLWGVKWGLGFRAQPLCLLLGLPVPAQEAAARRILLHLGRRQSGRGPTHIPLFPNSAYPCDPSLLNSPSGDISLVSREASHVLWGSQKPQLSPQPADQSCHFNLCVSAHHFPTAGPDPTPFLVEAKCLWPPLGSFPSRC